MPLFEVETDCHIIITWASDEDAASTVVNEAYPGDRVIRLTKRPPRHVGDFQVGPGHRRQAV
jgi:hypothetical protein